MKKKIIYPAFLLLAISSLTACNEEPAPSTPGNQWTLDSETRQFISTYKYTLDPGPDGILSNLNLEHLPSTDDTITITGVLKSAPILVVPESVRGLKVTGIGPKAFSSRTLNTRLEEVTLPSSITSIGDEAFENDQSLTDIKFGNVDNLTFVGDKAFGSLYLDEETSTYKSTTPYYQSIIDKNEITYFGTNLISVPKTGVTSIDVKEGTTTIGSFSVSNSEVSSISLPNTITHIGSYAFSNSKLSSIELPDGVISLGERAFSDNEALTRVYMPNNTDFSYSESTSYFEGSKNIDEIRYDGNAELKVLFGNPETFENNIKTVIITPSKEKKLVKGALNGVDGLESLKLISNDENEQVTVIEDGALPEQLSNFKEFIYGDQFEFFGDNSAYQTSPHYTSLSEGLVVFGKCLIDIKGTIDSSTTLPSNIVGISSGAIKDKLNLVSLPSSLKYIGKEAFKSNKTIMNVNLPNCLFIGESAFAECENIEKISLGLNCELSKNAFYNDLNVTELDFNPSMSLKDLFGTIDLKLEEIVLNEGVTEIKPSAFEGLDSLKSVTLPSTLSIIGEKAFKNCKSLKTIVIPERVKEIGSWAFAYCDSLESVTFDKTTLTHPDAFDNSIIRPDIYLSIMSFAFAYDKALTGEFIIRNRTIYVGGGIVFGSGITKFKIEMDRNYLQDLDFSRFNPLNEDNDMKFQNSWNLAEEKDSFGNQKKIPFTAVEDNFILIK